MPKKLSPEAAEKARKNGCLGGRPKVVIDYKALENLCKIQCTGEECAAVLGIDYDTLNRHLKNDGHGGFTDYFKKHSSSGRASLRRMQFRSAEDGNATMQIWLGKQYLEQKDKQDIEHSGEGITFNMNYGAPPKNET